MRILRTNPHATISRCFEIFTLERYLPHGLEAAEYSPNQESRIRVEARRFRIVTHFERREHRAEQIRGIL